MDKLNILSMWALPMFILCILIFAFCRGIKVYEVFVEGAEEGIETVLKIVPYLTAMIVAVNLFRTSGILDILLNITSSFWDRLNIPQPAIPLLFLRPLSGSASLAYINSIFTEYGVDSYVGRLVSTIQGSTETTFYIAAVYFGAVGVKKYRYALIVGLLADIAGFFAAVFICKILF
ncbi:MAG: spore maturation protein [Halanaerobiales bacterium]